MKMICAVVAMATGSFLGFAEESSLEVRPSLQWFGYGLYQDIADSKLNAGNTLFKVPDRGIASDLRPKLKIKSSDGKFLIVARGQFLTEASGAEVAEKRTSERPQSSSRILDSFVEWNATDTVLFSFGIQNYQWGAAESLNPSNRIFHTSNVLKDQLSESSSKNVARVNLTWMKNFSTVFLSENEEVKDSEIFRAEEEFQTTSLLKNELSWKDGSDYIGIVVGTGDRRGEWIGEYFNLTLFDGLSFYGDASHQKGSEAWYPGSKESNAAPGVMVTEFTQSKLDSSTTETLAVVGLRYSFEGGSDLRIEAIHNSGGWTKEEFELIPAGFDISQPAQAASVEKNIARWLRPGLELRGQNYGLFSLRLADFIYIKDLTLSLRCLHSTTDSSGATTTGMDYAINESPLTLLASLRANYGKQDSDLNNLSRSTALAGIRYDF